jgi:hypothetical protein
MALSVHLSFQNEDVYQVHNEAKQKDAGEQKYAEKK